MKNSTKILIAIAALGIIQIPIMKVVMSGKLLKGNRDFFLPDNTDILPNNILNSKKIIFLGSSVTYGSASLGNSFVEYLEKRDGVISLKEAVSGTTLVDEKVMGKESYIERLKKIDKAFKADAFICQLSTNDATMKKPLGFISNSFNKDEFDTKTITGAIEYVIAYAREIWNCPIIFYTGTKYDSKEYELMIERLYEIQKKWDIEIIDLWHDDQMNQVTKEEYKIFMANGIHPTMAGYRDWWTPKFEEKLINIFKEKEKE